MTPPFHINYPQRINKPLYWQPCRPGNFRFPQQPFNGSFTYSSAYSQMKYMNPWMMDNRTEWDKTMDKIADVTAYAGLGVGILGGVCDIVKNIFGWGDNGS